MAVEVLPPLAQPLPADLHKRQPPPLPLLPLSALELPPPLLLVLLLLLLIASPAECQQALGMVTSFEEELRLGMAAFNSLAKTSVRLSPRCTRLPSILYDQRKVEGARQVIAGQATDLPPWSPHKDKFLILHCFFGGVTNHKLCLRNFMIVAGLLNRTLVVFNTRQDHWTWMLDINATRACFGPNTVITLSELQALKQPNSASLASKVDEALAPDKMVSLRLGNWVSFERTIQQYQETTANITALDVGDLAAAKVPHSYYIYGDIPFRRTSACSTALAIFPHPKIVLSAHKYVLDHFGRTPYLSVHWRQGDFIHTYCGASGRVAATSTVCLREWTITQCIAAKAKSVGVKTIVVSSNGTPQSLQEMQNILEKAGYNVTVNPSLDSPDPEFLTRRVQANIEFVKLVLALAHVFVGTEASTFTSDIERMRKGLGLVTCMDSILCEGFPFKIHRMPPEYQDFFDNLI